jgi:hypothetical protein
MSALDAVLARLRAKYPAQATLAQERVQAVVQEHAKAIEQRKLATAVVLDADKDKVLSAILDVVAHPEHYRGQHIAKWVWTMARYQASQDAPEMSDRAYFALTRSQVGMGGRLMELYARSPVHERQQLTNTELIAKLRTVA